MQLQCVERYLPKVVPGTSDWDLAWNKGLCSCNYGKNLEMRSSWIGVALNPVIGVLIRERKEEKADRHGGKGHVVMETEIGVMYL